MLKSAADNGDFKAISKSTALPDFREYDKNAPIIFSFTCKVIDWLLSLTTTNFQKSLKVAIEFLLLAHGMVYWVVSNVHFWMFLITIHRHQWYLVNLISNIVNLIYNKTVAFLATHTVDNQTRFLELLSESWFSIKSWYIIQNCGVLKLKAGLVYIMKFGGEGRGRVRKLELLQERGYSQNLFSQQEQPS